MLIASTYRSSMTVNNIMAAFRKARIVPFNPDVVLSQLNICPTVSSTAQPSNRKERKDTRVVRVLLLEKVQKLKMQMQKNGHSSKKCYSSRRCCYNRGSIL